MNRRILLLPLFLLATLPLFSVDSVVVLDLSYSMGLTESDGRSRIAILTDVLADHLRSDPGSRHALLTVENGTRAQLLLPYPATPEAVLVAISELEPWGAVSLEAALAAGRRVASTSLPDGSEVVLVTDAEDPFDYLARHLGQATNNRPRLSGIPLTLITIGPQRSGVSAWLTTAVSESGGRILTPPDTAAASGISADPGSLTADRTHETAGIRAQDPGTVPGASRGRFVSAWLQVFKWNLLVASIGGLVVIVMAILRWQRRRNNARKHNATPPESVFDIKASITVNTQRVTGFPVTAGSTRSNSIHLPDDKTIGRKAFTLTLDGGVLRFASPEKLPINGVRRTEWELTPGDQIRVGKYRVIFRELIVPKKLPAPRIDFWRIIPLPVITGIAALLLFLLLPFQTARAESGAITTIAAATDVSEAARPDGTPGSEVGPGSSVGPASPVGSARIARETVPPRTYLRGDKIDFFDADFMLIHAHPDDESLDNGVLLSRLTSSGHTGVAILLTDGESGRDQYPLREIGDGYPPRDLVGAELAATRATEARRALGRLGVQAYIRGGLPNSPYNSLDELLTPDQVIRRWGGLNAIVNELERLFEQFRPEILISPDSPRGPYEHFEHEAAGIVAEALVDRLLGSDGAGLRAHIKGIDPLQTEYYGALLRINPWENDPNGVPYRSYQIAALLEHQTQRDASTIGIETRLAVPAEFYAVGFWDETYRPPAAFGISDSPLGLARMSLR